MLSLLICSVSALLLLWLRQHVAAVAWEAAAAFVRLMLACEACSAAFAPGKNLPSRSTRSAFIAPTRRQRRLYCSIAVQRLLSHGLLASGLQAASSQDYFCGIFAASKSQGIRSYLTRAPALQLAATLL